MLVIDDAVRVALNERVSLGRVCHRRVQFSLYLRFGLFLFSRDVDFYQKKNNIPLVASKHLYAIY